MVLTEAQLKHLFKAEGINLKAKAIHDLIDTIVDKSILSLSVADVGLGVTADPTYAGITVGKLALPETDTEPTDPLGGNAVMWMADGSSGSGGDAGDIMMKISSPAGSGVVTKTVTLVDFSTS